MFTSKGAEETLKALQEHDLGDFEPTPVRREFLRDEPLKSEDLEKIAVQLGFHRNPERFGDKVALGIVKKLRWVADHYFRYQYLHRFIFLETVAAVPGMVGGLLQHLRCLRTMKQGDNAGWIQHLLHEAENERMHLMVWMEVTKPTLFERFLVVLLQGAFYNVFFALYLFSSRTAHRLVGYLEEEAVISYTHFLKEIDEGKIKNVPAVPIAIKYWNLAPDATLRDVVLAVRADEAAHRDANHHFSDRITEGRVPSVEERH